MSASLRWMAWQELLDFEQAAEAHMALNLENPTGHYSLRMVWYLVVDSDNFFKRPGRLGDRGDWPDPQYYDIKYHINVQCVVCLCIMYLLDITQSSYRFFQAPKRPPSS